MSVAYVVVGLVCGVIFFFFFQAEDGIRDYKVTGVQTCALPILRLSLRHNPLVNSVAVCAESPGQTGKGTFWPPIAPAPGRSSVARHHVVWTARVCAAVKPVGRKLDVAAG